jgi:glycosyltransferase involved in cell wall biosynthesis
MASGAPGGTRKPVSPGTIISSAPEAIADRVAWFLARRGQLEEMRQTCRAKASEYTWEAYFDRVARAISPVPELVS